MTKLMVPLAIAALVLMAAACGSKSGTTQSAAQRPTLTDLRDIGQLRSLFNSRSGEPRLILLVSPT